MESSQGDGRAQSFATVFLTMSLMLLVMGMPYASAFFKLATADAQQAQMSTAA